MKKIFLFATVILASGCDQPGTVKTQSVDKNQPSEKYILTYNHEEFNPATNKSEIKKQVGTLIEKNDTTAYLLAVKKWYDKKIEERKTVSPGLYRSFIITDKNGIDLAVKLPNGIVNGINNQVKSLPEVKQLIEDIMQDSLPH